MITVVLVRPAGPRNVGAVLRAATNFGPAELRVVSPVRRSLLVHPDFVQMSHGVEEEARRIRVFDDVESALGDQTFALGFTARSRQHRTIHDWRDVTDDLVERTADTEQRVAVCFGNEETGLSGPESDAMQRLVRMPTTDEHGSINLAMTVGIVLSTLFFRRAASASGTSRAPLTGESREYLKRHVAEVLEDAALSDPIKKDIRASVERVFSTAELETRDGRSWHAVMRALGNRKKPSDYGLDPTPEAGDRRRRAQGRRSHAGD